MAVGKGFLAVAAALEAQAVSDLSHSDIRKRLSDALDANSKNGAYCYICDVFGDGESGDVVYSLNGCLKKAPYEISNSAASIDFDSAVDVNARTVYEEEPDESDHMASMEASAKLYRELPSYERYIAKSERDQADSGSFAGKGKSFPILKPQDVQAAVRSIGRAGEGNYGPAALKKNIVRIAKAKGWAKYLPKAWRDTASTDAKPGEAKPAALENGELRLAESATFCEPIKVSEAARADYAVKLIQPGWGSSGYYPAEMLERDGPKIFAAGTHMYWNHPTNAEESARPEGDLNQLAAVLTSNAYFDAKGKEGAGLYARAKVFSDYADKVAEKGPHSGLSIRAAGKAREGEAEGRKGYIIEQLTRADSVDFVTKPGAGGKVLTEAARTDADITRHDLAPQPNDVKEGADAMDAAELTKLQEAVKIQADVNRKLSERLALRDAADLVVSELKAVRLPEATKDRLAARLPGMAPIKDGVLDVEAFKTMIAAEAKDEAAYLERIAPSGKVTGMGAPAPAAADPKETEKKFGESMNELAATLGFTGEAAKRFVEGRAA